jgi:hypothetical protein
LQRFVPAVATPVDPDARRPDDPLLDYFALIVLI